MKKFASLTLLFAALTSQSAYTYCPEIAFRDGFYGSASLGANWSNEEWSGISFIGLVDDDSSISSKNIFETTTPKGLNRDNGKFIGSVSLGYQLVDCLLYLGAQVSGTFRTKREAHHNHYQTYFTVLEVDGTTLSGSALTQTKVSLGTCEFDADLKPGILICPNFLVYALGGVAVTEYKICNSGSWTEQGSEVDLQELIASASSHHHKNVVGFRAGAGMEYLVTDYLGISLDYIFSDYGKIRAVSVAENTNPPLWNLVYGIHAPEITVTTHTLKAGLVFHY